MITGLLTVSELMLCWAVSGTTVPITLSKGIDLQMSSPRDCQIVEDNTCSPLSSLVYLPNLFGDMTTKDADSAVGEFLSHFTKHSASLVAFACSLYLPPCPEKHPSGHNLDWLDTSQPDPLDVRPNAPLLPCRSLCELAFLEGSQLAVDQDVVWPVLCSKLPNTHCFNIQDDMSLILVKSESPSVHPQDRDLTQPAQPELDEDESYQLEVVGQDPGPLPGRRYDVTDMGDPDLFQGWVDVQGRGAANDYCRVVGKGKRRFLSCNLAGQTGQGHHYVSKLGFEPGLSRTWFMRDMDADGRDDYCRCVGLKNNSRITCMKAGQHGFYGNPMQGGSQHTFVIANSHNCYNQRLHPLFGEPILWEYV